MEKQIIENGWCDGFLFNVHINENRLWYIITNEMDYYIDDDVDYNITDLCINIMNEIEKYLNGVEIPVENYKNEILMDEIGEWVSNNGILTNDEHETLMIETEKVEIFETYCKKKNLSNDLERKIMNYIDWEIL